jgi:signal transduction histidine kinase
MVHAPPRFAAASAGRGPCLYPQGPEATPLNLDELLGTVAHELRSPLATVLTGVYLMSSECDLDPVARQALRVVEHQSERALRLVDDLFDLCAGGLGKLSLCKEVVAIADVAARAIETAGHLLTARRHRLTVSLPPEPLCLEADPLRLEQILTNLLGNAAKFTDPGGHIRLSAMAEDGQVVIRVQDNGRGIAPDLLPRVFDLFHQTSGPAARGMGGLGIGLTLVKSLVELHGGSVVAHSNGPGTGSEFAVCLPSRVGGLSTPERSTGPHDAGAVSVVDLDKLDFLEAFAASRKPVRGSETIACFDAREA